MKSTYLYAEQDKVDEQKESLIEEIEARLKQNIQIEPMFTKHEYSLILTGECQHGKKTKARTNLD